MEFEEYIRLAIIEDIGEGDHTTLACFPETALGQARLNVKAGGILAGVSFAEKVFLLVDPRLKFTLLIKDGTEVKPGDVAFEVEGPVRSILPTERLVLNIMQRMSGIATQTNRLVKLISGTKARILDTRKTTPLNRFLEKEAVSIGGGYNHRMGLYDMILLKDNHVDFCGGIRKAIENANNYQKRMGKVLPIEVEVRNPLELEEVVDQGGIQRIMFDNFTPEQLHDCVKLVNGKFETEASGGIRESNILEYAQTGVDFVSIGSITHSVESLDLSLKARIS